MDVFSLISTDLEFEWDQGNETKNFIKHQVNKGEIEEVFFNQPLILAEDINHSYKEARYMVLGQTNEKRKLFMSFTVRNQKIRVISARDQDRKERRAYEKETAVNSTFS